MLTSRGHHGYDDGTGCGGTLKDDGSQDAEHEAGDGVLHEIAVMEHAPYTNNTRSEPHGVCLFFVFFSQWLIYI